MLGRLDGVDVGTQEKVFPVMQDFLGFDHLSDLDDIIIVASVFQAIGDDDKEDFAGSMSGVDLGIGVYYLLDTMSNGVDQRCASTNFIVVLC